MEAVKEVFKKLFCWSGFIGYVMFVLPQPAREGSTATPWMLNAAWSVPPTACPMSQGPHLVPAMQASTEHLRRARTLLVPVSCTQKEISKQPGGWTYWEQHHREELGGTAGWKIGHELAAWACSPESQVYLGLHQKHVASRARDRILFSTLLLWDLIWRATSSSGAPSTRDTGTYWIRSRGGPQQ